MFALPSHTGAGNSDPGSAGFGPKDDLRPADRYSTFPFKVVDPRTSLAIPLILSRDSHDSLEPVAYQRLMRRKWTAFLNDESGATAIEYGLIASGIAVAIIAAVKGVGTNLKTNFGSISTAVK